MGRITAPLQRDLLQAGMTTTVGTIVLSSACLALGGFVVVRTLFFSTILALAVGMMMSLAPFIYVRHKKNQRLKKFEEQFPEAIDLIARALRAGHAFTTGLAMAAEEIPAPVGQEFKLLYDRQNFGMPMPEAMRAFAARIPLIDARFFVTAVLTQRETGGNMSEVLDKLASVIRERFKVKRQVKVVSAHGRITGVVLGFLPPVVAGLIFIVSPDHIRLLVDDPLGMYMLVIGAVLQVTGVLIIRRIVDVEY
jgi:tight adherence protein B